jgi:hypothetical protein
MKRHELAPIVAMVFVCASGVSTAAAAATESECTSAGAAAEQLRSTGDLFGARVRLGACLVTGCSTQVREACARQLAAVVAAMPAVVLEAKDQASNNLSAVRVTLDGAPVLDRLDGAAILVNPGEHRVAFEAAGFRRAEATFVALEPQKKVRVVVFLDSAPSSVSPSSAASDRLLVSPVANVTVRHEEPTSSAGRRRQVALALGCAGIAGVAVGTIWSVMSKRTYDRAFTSECGSDPNGCSALGISDGQKAHREAAVATVAFVTAGALVAAGAVLYLTSPKQSGVAVAPMADRSAGLALIGKW